MTAMYEAVQGSPQRFSQQQMTDVQREAARKVLSGSINVAVISDTNGCGRGREGEETAGGLSGQHELS